MFKEQKGIMCQSMIINKSSGKMFLPRKLNISAYNFKEHGMSFKFMASRRSGRKNPTT